MGSSKHGEGYLACLICGPFDTDRLWKGFLASKLSSVDLIWFALATFVMAPNTLRFRLIKHLIVDPSGADLVQTYAGLRGSSSSSSSTDLKPV